MKIVPTQAHQRRLTSQSLLSPDAAPP